jgi:flavin-binding protein dodecin
LTYNKRLEGYKVGVSKGGKQFLIAGSFGRDTRPPGAISSGSRRERAGFERGAGFSHENARERNEVYSQEDTMAKQQRMQVSPQKASMAEQQADTVYKIVDVVGVSEKSWEDAGRNAVETAAGSLRELRVAEVTKWT